MAGRPSLRESLGLPTRVEPPPGRLNPKRHSKAAGGGGRGAAPAGGQNRRRTHVLSQGSRPSSGAVGQGSHKRSSVYGQGVHSQPRKDPRPLSDKAYQLSSIKKIIAFLADKNYGKAYTTKQLQQPPTKEFLHIFNFLVTMVDPSLEVNGLTIVEDIPKTLKLMGYPYTVSKNHMLNVGSPHSWPILLGALSWLVDACNLPDRTTDLLFPSETDFNDEETRAKEQEMRIEAYMYDIYLQYGHNSPEYEDLIQQKAEANRQRVEEVQEALVKIMDMNIGLEKEVEHLSESSIPVLVGRREENQQNIAALQDKVERELPCAIATAEDEIARLQEDHSTIEMQTAASIERSKELEDQIRCQPMSATDARELRQSISDTEHTLGKHRKIQQQNTDRIEELQMLHNRSVSVIDSACRQANDKLHRLSAVLPDAASLSPLEYDTSCRADPEVLQRLVSQAKNLRQRVQSLHQDVAVRMSELESKIISGESTQSAIHNEMVKKQLENDNLQHTLDIEKGQLDQKKRKFEEAIKVGQAELHALQKEQISLQQRVQEGPHRQQQQLEACKREFDQEVMSMARDLEKKDLEFEQCVIALAKVMETAQNHKDQYSRQVAELTEEFSKVKTPSVPASYLPSGKH